MIEIEITAAFEFTDDHAVSRLRDGLPSAEEVTADGTTVRVRSGFDDSIEGPGELPDGAFVAMRQVLQVADIAGVGPAREWSLTVRDTG
jgi:hypothetical protein